MSKKSKKYSGFQVFTKAGQKGNKFRYYALFTSINDKKISDYNKEIIDFAIKKIDEKFKSEVESISFGDDTYVQITWLIPDTVAPQKVYDLFLDVLSSKFQILNYHVNTSNVDNFTEKDIITYKKFLKNREHKTND